MGTPVARSSEQVTVEVPRGIAESLLHRIDAAWYRAADQWARWELLSLDEELTAEERARCAEQAVAAQARATELIEAADLFRERLGTVRAW